MPNSLVYPIEGLEQNPLGGLHVFFGIETSGPSLEGIFEFYAPRIPHGIVQIAANGGGDYACLDLRHGRERVIFWDKAHFWSTGEWRDEDLYPIANTFEEFLSLLKPSPY